MKKDKKNQSGFAEAIVILILTAIGIGFYHGADQQDKRDILDRHTQTAQ